MMQEKECRKDQQHGEGKQKENSRYEEYQEQSDLYVRVY